MLQAERITLPEQIQEVIQRFMSESETQLAAYRAELSRAQQETLIGTMVSGCRKSTECQHA